MVAGGEQEGSIRRSEGEQEKGGAAEGSNVVKQRKVQRGRLE